MNLLDVCFKDEQQCDKFSNMLITLQLLSILGLHTLCEFHLACIITFDAETEWQRH